MKNKYTLSTPKTVATLSKITQVWLKPCFHFTGVHENGLGKEV